MAQDPNAAAAAADTTEGAKPDEAAKPEEAAADQAQSEQKEAPSAMDAMKGKLSAFGAKATEVAQDLGYVVHDIVHSHYSQHHAHSVHILIHFGAL